MSLEQGSKARAAETRTSAERFITNWLASSDIKVNGDRPWDIMVNDKSAYGDILRDRDVGIGNSYMKGKWDSDDIPGLMERAVKTQLLSRIPVNKDLVFAVLKEKSRKVFMSKAAEVGEKHYDIGNDLYEEMLGETMSYTCGYWKDAESLDAAQIAKMDLLGKKLDLRRGMSVLDIGGGYGSLAIYLARNFGVRVVNVGISKEQIRKADELAVKENLPQVNGFPAVENRFLKYQDLVPNEKFDRVVSVGMFEHVGGDYHKPFIERAESVLKDDGIFILHTIGAPTPSGQKTWITENIFPNGQIPSLSQITKAAEEVFNIRDVHAFPNSYYDKTLMAWYENFEKAWDKLKVKKYGDPTKIDNKGEFYRMWKLYLQSCAGLFRGGYLQLWQIAMTKQGIPSEYKSVR